MSKAIAIGYLMRVSASNVNASHNEGNVIVTKKVTLPDGNTLPYISGQALRRMFRDRLEDLGWKLSEPSPRSPDKRSPHPFVLGSSLMRTSSVTWIQRRGICGKEPPLFEFPQQSASSLTRGIGTSGPAPLRNLERAFKLVETCLRQNCTLTFSKETS